MMKLFQGKSHLFTLWAGYENPFFTAFLQKLKSKVNIFKILNAFLALENIFLSSGRSKLNKKFKNMNNLKKTLSMSKTKRKPKIRTGYSKSQYDIQDR